MGGATLKTEGPDSGAVRLMHSLILRDTYHCSDSTVGIIPSLPLAKDTYGR